MTEIVVGVSRGTPLSRVLSLTLEEIALSQGQPRELILEAPDIAVVGQRSQCEGGFESVLIRVPVERVGEDLRGLTAECAGCSATETDGLWEARISTDPENADPENAEGSLAERLDQLATAIELPEVWRISGKRFRDDAISPAELLQTMSRLKATDVHLYAGSAPVYRVDNRMGRVAWLEHVLANPLGLAANSGLSLGDGADGPALGDWFADGEPLLQSQDPLGDGAAAAEVVDPTEVVAVAAELGELLEADASDHGEPSTPHLDANPSDLDDLVDADGLLEPLSDLAVAESEVLERDVTLPPVAAPEVANAEAVPAAIVAEPVDATAPSAGEEAGEPVAADQSAGASFAAADAPESNSLAAAPAEFSTTHDDIGETDVDDPIGELAPNQILELVERIAPPEAWRRLGSEHQCSFRFHQLGEGYARVSAFIKRGVPHCTFRFLPEAIPSFDDLRMPSKSMRRIANLHYGLVLVTGMTGSGKSTTVASLIDWLNSHKSLHILTIEEPVEYVHINRKSVVSQREIGVDVDSFRSGVHGALRHDPDVIFIGEMRDADTIRAAIRAAATGHLVISTMHSNTTCDVVNQIVSFFDPVERDLVRLQLRESLRCVLCQRLVPKADGGRVATLEFLFNDTDHIAEAIYAGDSESLRIAMQQRFSESSLFEEHLLTLIEADLMEVEQAVRFAPNPHVLEQMHLGTYAVPTLHADMTPPPGGRFEGLS